MKQKRIWLLIKHYKCDQPYGPHDSQVIGFSETKSTLVKIIADENKKYSSKIISGNMKRDLELNFNYVYDRLSQQDKLNGMNKQEVRDELKRMDKHYDYLEIEECECLDK